MHPFKIIEEFEKAVCEYTGAKYCVAVNSCTNALFLSLKLLHHKMSAISEIEIPKKTYISVPMQIKHAGFDVKFRDENWKGIYQLKPFPIYDAARRFHRDMYIKGSIMCTSHHWTKILAIQHGGCILHDREYIDPVLRKLRWDGRTDFKSVAESDFDILGYHCPMPPENAAAGLVRLAALKDYNDDLPCSDYIDLSKLEIFK